MNIYRKWVVVSFCNSLSLTWWACILCDKSSCTSCLTCGTNSEEAQWIADTLYGSVVMENVMMVAMTVLIMTMQIFVIERSMVFIHPSNDDKDLCEWEVTCIRRPVCGWCRWRSLLLVWELALDSDFPIWIQIEFHKWSLRFGLILMSGLRTCGSEGSSPSWPVCKWRRPRWAEDVTIAILSLVAEKHVGFW